MAEEDKPSKFEVILLVINIVVMIALLNCVSVKLDGHKLLSILYELTLYS